MLTKEAGARNALALGLCGLWGWLVVSGYFLSSGWMGYGAVAALYGLTLLLLQRLRASGARVAHLVLGVCVVTMALVVFIAWGLGLSIPWPLVVLQELPLELRLLPIFMQGLIAALLVAVLAFYPVWVLTPRVFWLAPALAALATGGLQFGALTGSETRELTRQVMIVELLCLALLVPLLIQLMGATWVGRRGRMVSSPPTN